MVEEGEPVWLETNRRLWDEMAALHPSTGLYDVDGLIAGRDDLRPWEDDDLGPLEGLDVVHLQCHIGTDTIGLARRGARVVGLDFSKEAVTAARQLSARCGLDVEWVRANVYDAIAAVGERTFDVVYTGMIEDGTTICQDALGAAYIRWDEPDRVSYADPDRPLSSVSSFERLHAISEVLTAVIDAGMTIELFHEFDVTPAPTSWLEPRADRLYGFPDGKPRFPLTYSLRARHPAP